MVLFKIGLRTALRSHRPAASGVQRSGPQLPVPIDPPRRRGSSEYLGRVSAPIPG